MWGILVIWLPLMSGLCVGILGRHIGEYGSSRISTGSIILTSLISWYKYINYESAEYINICTWLVIDEMEVNWSMVLDSGSLTMLVLLSTVSGLVHLYSIEYMRGDAHIIRFQSYLSIFTFSMIVLVTGSNLLVLFVGWELVGVSSYLLINYWTSIIEANKSSIQAMLMNRVGDIGLGLGLFTIYYGFKTLDIEIVNGLGSSMKDEVIYILGVECKILNVIGILLLIGCIGKSAQFGLQTWLANAMAGPTPVSALIHSSTMVTAGVYLLLRVSGILELAEVALWCIGIIGGMTAFMAASIATVQHDIKKVIAYSTCSQLGYMVLGCGLSNYSGSLNHLFIHGWIKSLLFLSAGSIIHAVHDEQDIRRMGGLKKLTPVTYSVMMIGSLSIIGFPFMSGFYSKDMILEVAGYNGLMSGTGMFIYLLGTCGAGLTAFYSFRLVYLSSLGTPGCSNGTMKGVHESNWIMLLPLVLLSIGATFGGYVFKDKNIGIGSTFYDEKLIVYPGHYTLIDAEFLSTEWKLLPVILSLLGGMLGIILYVYMGRALWEIKIRMPLYSFLSNKWYFDYVYNVFLGKILWGYGNEITYKLIDTGILERLGPTGISEGVWKWAKEGSRLQSGYVFQYGLMIFAGVMVLAYVDGSTYVCWKIIMLLPLIGMMI